MRRTAHEKKSTHGDRRLTRRLPDLRAELERQRDFRDEQLALLVAHEHTRVPSLGHGPRAGDADGALAMREVRTKITTAARQALADIELALERMDAGQYARCRACGCEIPVAVLTAIPSSTLCMGCHHSAPEWAAAQEELTYAAW